MAEEEVAHQEPEAQPELDEVNVIDVRPLQKNLKLTVKVIDSKEVVNRGATKLQQATVGDASACIALTLRNEQGDLAKKGAVLTLLGARADVHRGSLKLSIPKGSSIEVDKGAKVQPNTAFNVSALEFTAVYLPTATTADIDEEGEEQGEAEEHES